MAICDPGCLRWCGSGTEGPRSRFQSAKWVSVGRWWGSFHPLSILIHHCVSEFVVFHGISFSFMSLKLPETKLDSFWGGAIIQPDPEESQTSHSSSGYLFPASPIVTVVYLSPLKLSSFDMNLGTCSNSILSSVLGWFRCTNLEPTRKINLESEEKPFKSTNLWTSMVINSHCNNFRLVKDIFW